MFIQYHTNSCVYFSKESTGISLAFLLIPSRILYYFWKEPCLHFFVSCPFENYSKEKLSPKPIFKPSGPLHKFGRTAWRYPSRVENIWKLRAVIVYSQDQLRFLRRGSIYRHAAMGPTTATNLKKTVKGKTASPGATLGLSLCDTSISIALKSTDE